MLKVSKVLVAQEDDKIVKAFLRSKAKALAFSNVVEWFKANQKAFPGSYLATNLLEHKPGEKLKTVPNAWSEALQAGLIQNDVHNGFYQTYTVTPKGLQVAEALKNAQG